MDTLAYLGTKEMDLFDYGREVVDLKYLPDGTIAFKTANKTRLDIHISINDKYYFTYHRANGISKLAVDIDSTPVFVVRSIEGLISFSDLINNAYMRTLFPKLYVMTAVNYLPMKLTQAARIDRIINMLGSGMFPLCLCLLLPVFIYAIVYEKEHKVLEIMKMNGMKMRYYWLVHFCFDFIIYTITFLVFFIYGGLILKFDCFLYTSVLFQIIMFVGWGYAQIAVAFFVSPFVSRSQSAVSKNNPIIII